MKQTLGILAVVGLVLALAFLLIRPGHSAPLTYTGELSLRTPVWANQDVLVPHSHPEVSQLARESFEPNLRYLDLAGSLCITQKGSPLALWINGEHSFSRGYFVHENKMKIGLDLAVRNTPLTIFSYFERRFDGEDLDRVFIGAKLGFRGTLD